MPDHHRFYIDGQWVEPVSLKTLDVINPAVTATLTSIHQPDPAPAVAEVVIRR